MDFMTAGCSIHILNNHEELSEYASGFLREAIKRNPCAVIGPSAGGTPELSYKKLGESGVDASGITLVQLDNYIPIGGVKRDEYNDYIIYLEKRIVGSFPEGKRPNKVYLIDLGDVTQQEIEKELLEKPHEYARIGSEIFLSDNSTGAFGEIKKKIDEFNTILQENRRNIQMLGINPSELYPHLAFLDYWTRMFSRTHLVELYRDTLEANSRFFGNHTEMVPKFAITQGPLDILEAETLLLLASGKRTAKAIKTTFLSPLDPGSLQVASARNIRLHDNTLVILDREASSEILPHLDAIKKDYKNRGKLLDIEIF